MAGEKKSFEEALARLEEVVGLLESGELTLDESLKLYEEGVGLIRFCSETLERAEARIKILQRTPEGDIKAFDFKSDAIDV
ncbi:MAG TPA: exodeoxyribonuclease VII small subunit [Clostridiales bacterium]|jgi:exodeoxyribonuclease VII small subunit|nr:exodeoxyribonuclease VII small subunit [Clostridiales bacterium]